MPCCTDVLRGPSAWNTSLFPKNTTNSCESLTSSADSTPTTSRRTPWPSRRRKAVYEITARKQRLLFAWAAERESDAIAAWSTVIFPLALRQVLRKDLDVCNSSRSFLFYLLKAVAFAESSITGRSLARDCSSSLSEASRASYHSYRDTF